MTLYVSGSRDNRIQDICGIFDLRIIHFVVFLSADAVQWVTGSTEHGGLGLVPGAVRLWAGVQQHPRSVWNLRPRTTQRFPRHRWGQGHWVRPQPDSEGVY